MLKISKTRLVGIGFGMVSQKLPASLKSCSIVMLNSIGAALLIAEGLQYYIAIIEDPVITYAKTHQPAYRIGQPNHPG